MRSAHAAFWYDDVYHTIIGKWLARNDTSLIIRKTMRRGTRGEVWEKM